MNRALEHWRERLSGSGLPAFARTVREVSHVAADHISSAKDLSAVVGRDAGLTSRLLQIVNSSLFNFQGRKIETVTAAVVMLGFDAVKELAVSVSVIDELLKGNQHARVSRCMAQSFLAAAQAKAFCSLVAPKQAEEVFVAALLKEVGCMAFWSRAGDEAGRLESALHNGGPSAEVERQVLGFTMQELSEMLAEEWSLGGLVKRVIKAHDHADPIIACATSGHELAGAVLEHGWRAQAVRDLLSVIASRLGLNEKELAKLAEDRGDEIEQLAQHFGVGLSPQALVPDVEQADAASGDQTVPAAEQAVSAMNCLQDLAAGMEDGRSRDELMQALVEGLRGATAAEACFFMLLTPDRSELIVKYAASGAEQIAGQRRAADHGVMGEALQSTKVLDARAAQAPPLERGGPCLLKGVHVGGKAVGVLVAEYQACIPAVATFRQFSQQIPLILTTAR